MLLIELIYHCERNLETAMHSYCNAAYSIAAEQLAELSNLIQNELPHATKTDGSPALESIWKSVDKAEKLLDNQQAPEQPYKPSNDELNRDCR